MFQTFGQARIERGKNMTKEQIIELIELQANDAREDYVCYRNAFGKDDFLTRCAAERTLTLSSLLLDIEHQEKREIINKGLSREELVVSQYLELVFGLPQASDDCDLRRDEIRRIAKRSRRVKVSHVLQDSEGGDEYIVADGVVIRTNRV